MKSWPWARSLRLPVLNNAPAVLHFGEQVGHVLVVLLGISKGFQLSIDHLHKTVELKDKLFDLQTSWVCANLLHLQHVAKISETESLSCSLCLFFS